MNREERIALFILSGGRLVIGTGIWLAPNASLGALGFRSVEGRKLAAARLVALRDLVLGGWLVNGTSDRARLAAAVRVTVIFDAADAIAFGLIALGSERYSKAGRRGAASALAATVLGAWLASELESGKRRKFRNAN